MGKRGPQPKGKVKIEWSPDFAYAIGLLVSDGCLSNNGRHILFVSKDEDQIQNFMKALNISVHIGKTYSGYKGSWALRVQFGDVLFYQFLLGIGLMPNKSKVIGAVKIPEEYFSTFSGALLTVMDVPTRIGINDGSRVSCSTRYLSRRAKITSCGFKRRFLNGCR